jgi:hypothetical protein
MNNGCWILSSYCPENDGEFIPQIIKNTELGIMRLTEEIDAYSKDEIYSCESLDNLKNEYNKVKYDTPEGFSITARNSRTMVNLSFYLGLTFP